MIFQALGGVSTENPENTMISIVSAAEQGYGLAGVETAVTKDCKFVLLRDDTINRTARFADGEELPKPVKIGEITYEQALEYDFGVWFSKKFKGTKIPLLCDVLEYARKNGIKIKIGKKYQNFSDKQRDKFFELLKQYEDVAALTSSDAEEIKNVGKILKKMYFHYDGEVSARILSEIGGVVPKERLCVWLPCENPEALDLKTAELIKEYAAIGVYGLQKLHDGEGFAPDFLETDGRIKPPRNRGMIADMHTHSEFSHDSVCKIEDMYEEQRKRGTDLFAVTDHFDTTFFNEYDIFSPIRKSFERVGILNAQHGEESILSGVEIGEGFWYPEEYEKVLRIADYDVIIGSVHFFSDEKLKDPYAQIDFSRLTKEDIDRCMDGYFDDMLKMLDTVDFDILAHLTCPLRYIRGKYGIDVDLKKYEEKIEKILKKIIKKGIALEINTSSFDKLGDFMPTTEILKKYYDMGGYLITLGSDAHTSERAAVFFGEAIEAIREIGFKNIYFYKKRRAYQITV